LIPFMSFHRSLLSAVKQYVNFNWKSHLLFTCLEIAVIVIIPLYSSAHAVSKRCRFAFTFVCITLLSVPQTSMNRSSEQWRVDSLAIFVCSCGGLSPRCSSSVGLSLFPSLYPQFFHDEWSAYLSEHVCHQCSLVYIAVVAESGTSAVKLCSLVLHTVMAFLTVCARTKIQTDSDFSNCLRLMLWQ
jgi:hypothetical protein